MAKKRPRKPKQPKKPVKGRKVRTTRNRDSRGRFAAANPKPKRNAPATPKRDARGRFISSKPKKQRRRRLRRPDKLMREIVAAYEADGIEIATYNEHVEDRELRGTEVWHLFSVEFGESFRIEDIPSLTDYFYTVLQKHYSQGTIIRVAIGVENSNGLASGLWRTLVATEDLNSAFSQVPNHAEAWLRGSDYTVVTGISVDTRAK